VLAQGHGFDGVIELEKWHRLVDALEAKKLLPLGLTAGTIKSFLPIILAKILHGNSKTPLVGKQNGLGLKQIAVLREIVEDWTVGQRAILGAFRSTVKMAPDDLARVISSLSVLPATTVGIRARDQLAKLVRDGRPLLRDADHRRVFVPPGKIPEFRLADLIQLNFLRVLVSNGIRAYSHSPKDADDLAGLSEAEVQEIYLDLREIGRELGLVDRRSLTAGIRTFMEANIFMSVSDGDDRMSLHEGVEWIHTVMSASTIAGRIHADLKPECGLEKNDGVGRVTLELDCFRRRFAADFALNLSNMPLLVQWFSADPLRDLRPETWRCSISGP
jgi:hypothetical protein